MLPSPILIVPPPLRHVISAETRRGPERQGFNTPVDNPGPFFHYTILPKCDTPAHSMYDGSGVDYTSRSERNGALDIAIKRDQGGGMGRDIPVRAELAVA